MIKLLKLQKPLCLIILGILSFITSRILYGANVKNGVYFEFASGALLVIGALWFLYPILFAKKNDKGRVEISTDGAHEDSFKNNED